MYLSLYQLEAIERALQVDYTHKNLLTPEEEATLKSAIKLIEVLYKRHKEFNERMKITMRKRRERKKNEGSCSL